MSRTDEPDSRPDPRAPEPAAPVDDPVRRLLHLAGPRPEAPADLAEAARRAVDYHWRQAVARRRQRRLRRLALGGLAAALAVALAATLWPGGSGDPATASAGAPPATVTAASGPLLLESPGDRAAADDGGGRWLGVGDEVSAGSRLATPPGSLAALRLPGGRSLRIDERSRLTYAATGRIELAGGAVYVDSDPTAQAAEGHHRPEIMVTTPFGPIEEIGTQFEVRLGKAADDGEPARGLIVKVREGRVAVRSAGEQVPDGVYQGRAGEALLWPAAVEGRTAALGEPLRRPVTPFDDSWGWALAAAPPRQIEGLSLAEILRWVGRETGWRVAVDPAAEPLLDRPLLGELSARPAEAPELVLPAFGLGHRVEEGVLHVAPR